MVAPASATQIDAFIKRRDPSFAPVIAAVGPVPMKRAAPIAQRYAALARSITAQLLATGTATTIHGRVGDLCGGEVTIEAVLALGADELRSAGLTRTKARAMVELAESVRDGRVSLARHGRMSDEDVAREVTVVRGIGPWTAHMYLLDTLARRDVWPVGDFGVRHGWTIVHGLDDLISERELRDAGEILRGVRSSVAWYCWQAVHLSRRTH